jgi:hypothetical protein
MTAGLLAPHTHVLGKITPASKRNHADILAALGSQSCDNFIHVQRFAYSAFNLPCSGHRLRRNLHARMPAVASNQNMLRE